MKYQNQYLMGSHGHFDPLTLSIYESTVHYKVWRERIEEISKYVYFDDEERPIIDFDDFVAYSVSIHENDHFIRHTSNEYGLLVSFLHHIRWISKIGYWQSHKHKNEKELSIFTEVIKEFDFLYEILFLGNMKITQQQAVDC